MSRVERRRIISEIEELRGSRVLSFVTGDRGPIPAQMGDDAIDAIYAQIRKIGHVDRLDLFINSRGGAMDVPWRIASRLRKVAAEWNVLVARHANSAATLLALGADEIVLAAEGELGPIDPILTSPRMSPDGTSLVHDTINVEDIMAFLRFIRERAGLTDQESVAETVGLMIDRISPNTVGNAERTHSHVRDVARRMLLSRNAPPGEQDLTRIVQTLAEKVYAHGHAITVADATEIGLPVRDADSALDDALWRLLMAYQEDLKLRDPVDPAFVTEGQDLYIEDTVAAVVETTAGSHELTAQLHVEAKREPLPTGISIPITLPGVNIQEENLEPGIRQLWQQIQQAIQGLAEQALQQALVERAPVTDIQTSLRGAKWLYYDAALATESAAG